MRILSLYDKRLHPDWIRRVEVFEEYAQEERRNWGKKSGLLRQTIRELRWLRRLFIKSQGYDVVLVGCDRLGLIFAALQQLSSSKRVSVVFLNFMVNIDGGFFRFFKAALYRAALMGCFRAIVFRRCEIGLYSRALKVPATKLAFVPYHATLYDTDREIADLGYVFAGGDTNRDYATLIEAVRGTNIPLTIACLSREHFTGIDIPPNVTILSANEAEYIRLLSQSTLTVVPLKSRPQHVGGEQTYANAMTLGKPVIVTDLGAADYIEHNVSGVLTAAGNADALRSAILDLFANRSRAHQMGEQAKSRSKEFKLERYFDGVVAVCNEAASKRSMEAGHRP